MLGISEIVHIVSSDIVKVIQEHFENNNVNLDDLEITIPGKHTSRYNDIQVDEWIIQHSKTIHYDHSNSGFIDNKYRVYLYLNFSYLTLDAIIHEIKHAYVDWCIFKNKGRPIKETKEAKELYTEDFSKLISKEINLFPNLKDIIMMYYYSTKLEIPSFLENHFLDSSHINYKSISIKMINIDIQKYKNEDSKKEFEKLKLYNIPKFNKHYNCDDFLEKTKKFFKIRGFYILKRVNRLEVLKKNKNI
jgi:hypothetical protein